MQIRMPTALNRTLSHSRPYISHRFVVVWRCEAREIVGAAKVWRGWIERIPDPRQRFEDGQTEERLGFNDLDEVPERIRALIEDAGQSDRRSRS